MKHFFTVFLFLLTSSIHAQSIVYVTQSGAGDQSGSSWSNALPGTQLQNRLASAATGTQFWVAGGTYRPTTGTDYSISFSIPSGVQVYGGFIGNEANLSAPKLSGPSSTTFTGNIGDLSSNEDNSRHVVQFRNAANDTRLDGVVVTGGYAGENSNRVGGGIYNDGSSGGTSNPTITNCLITNNYVGNHGGGIFSNGYQGTCSPQIINCVISNNQASGNGGGMYNNGYQGYCNPIAINCLFNDNVAPNGGAIYNEAFQGTCRPTFLNCTIVRNHATNQYLQDNLYVSSGALYNHGPEGTSSPILTNCIIWDNFSTTGASGVIYNDQATISVDYSDVQGGYPGSNNINANPLFADNSDFRPSTRSPVINAGDPNSNTNNVSAVDLTGKPRIQQTRIDMGAYEYLQITDRFYVTPSGAGDRSGSSWANALGAGQLKSYLANAAPGSVFWLAGGIYSPGLITTETFQIASGVQVYGGFKGIETSLSERVLTGPSSTTLSGEEGDPAYKEDNNRHVIRFTDVSSSTRLDGVVITGGNANTFNLVDNNGGGILNISSQPGVVSSPTIANCYFINNYAFNGGGICNSANSGGVSNPTLINCHFVNNSAGEGGAFTNVGTASTANPTLIDCYFDNNVANTYNGGAISNVGSIDANGIANPTLRNCTFTNNKAAGYGGAISSQGSYGQANPIISNCKFIGNTATYGGGAVNSSGYYGGQSFPVLVNCQFSGNTATDGGAVNSEGNNGRCDPVFTNCTFVQNNAGTSGGAIRNKSTTDTGLPYSSNATLKNCILYNNTAPDGQTFKNLGPNTSVSVTYSNIQGGFSGTGNIDQDPQFIDASNGNYRLKAGSPCINAGDPNSNASTVSEKDLDGNPRVADNRIDIGAYEFQATSQTGSDLNLNLRVDNRTPNTNQPVSYFLTVTNNGPVTATNVVWQNRLPDNLNFVGGEGVMLDNRVLSGQIESLATGASTTFTYQLQPIQAGQYINAAQITASSQPDPDSQPNSGTGDGQDDAASTEIRTPNSNGQVFASANPNQVPLPSVQSNQPTPDPNKIDLAVGLAVSNRTPKVGDLLAYTLTITNQGGTTANNVSVTAYLPAGQQFDSSTDMAPSGEGVTGGLSSIAIGSKSVLQFKTRVTATGVGLTKVQVRQANPTDTDSTPDNGTENGEDDTTRVDLRIVAQ